MTDFIRSDYWRHDDASVDILCGSSCRCIDGSHICGNVEIRSCHVDLTRIADIFNFIINVFFFVVVVSLFFVSFFLFLSRSV